MDHLTIHEVDALRAARSAAQQLDQRLFDMAVDGVRGGRVREAILASENITRMLERLA